MLRSVHVVVPAKINLHLKVNEKRDDGFHDIESIFQKIPLYDELLIEMADTKNTCKVDSPVFKLPENNTLTSAYSAFCAATGISVGVNVALKKHIPSGAGMGGGSSDAAGMLRGLQELFEVSLTDAELKKAAETIGSDVSFFLYDGEGYDTAIVTGRGENVKYIKSRRDLFYVLVCPGVHSSTKEAYDLVDNWNNGGSTTFPKLSELESIYRGSVKDWTFGNSFTKPVAGKYPIIQKAIDDLSNFNPEFVEMTGSGSVVFGIFSSENDAKKAYTQLCHNWKESYLLKTT